MYDKINHYYCRILNCCGLQLHFLASPPRQFLLNNEKNVHGSTSSYEYKHINWSTVKWRNAFDELCWFYMKSLTECYTDIMINATVTTATVCRCNKWSPNVTLISWSRTFWQAGRYSVTFMWKQGSSFSSNSRLFLDMLWHQKS